MLALVLLVFVFIIVVFCVTWRLPQRLRQIYLVSIACALILGSVASITYTIDNSLYNQDDIPGDSQYYFDGAMYYIRSGQTYEFYPVYQQYLALFLRDGHALTARLAQLLTWLLGFSTTVWSLALQGITREGLKRFSLLTVGNGLFYGLATAFHRDVLILVMLAGIHALVVWSETLNYRPALVIIPMLGVLLLVTYINELQPWLAVLLMLALLMEYGAWISWSRQWKLLTFLSVSAGLIGALAFNELITFLSGKIYLTDVLIQYVVIEGSMVELGGASRDILSPFRLLLGPGLIRPLFAGQYFQEQWLPSHAAFYWWGTLVWYIALLLGVPVLVRRPTWLFGTKGAVLLWVLFIGYFGSYLFAYGSGVQLRKRAIFCYLFLILIASQYWCTGGARILRRHMLQLNIPTNWIRIVLLAMMGVAQLASI